MIEKLKLSGIYAILNILNEKVYVGSAIHLYRRWRDHKLALNTNNHYNILLQRSWNKYGESNFIFVVLELIENTDTLLERETFWLKSLNSFNTDLGYNILCEAGSRFGMTNTNEHNLKISLSLTGFQRSNENKRNISNGKLGKQIHSEKSKLKISLSGKGRTPYNKNKGVIFTCIDGVKCKCNKCKEIKNKYKRDWQRRQIGIGLRNLSK